MKMPAWTITAFLIAGAAWAQQSGQKPEQQSGQATATNRFQLERTEHGVVRLDMATGAMTLCRDDDGTLVCRMQPDERAAFERELGHLEKRIAALEEKLSRAPPAAGSNSAGYPSSGTLPSDAEVERSLSIMEKFMRSFMTIIGEFEEQKKTGQSPADPT